MSNVATPVTAISLPAARLSILGAAAFSVLVVALHFIKREFDPSWRFISEYAIGSFGWLMMLAFFAMAVSCAALFVAIRSQVFGLAGRIGIVLLLIVAVALVAAGVFAMDPITATKDQLTTHGSLHGFASMVGVPGLPIAAVMISWSLGRNAAWSSERRRLVWTALFSLICLLAMFGYMGVTLPKAGGFGPGVMVGWFNRLLVLSYAVWLATASWSAVKVREQTI